MTKFYRIIINSLFVGVHFFSISAQETEEQVRSNSEKLFKANKFVEATTGYSKLLALNPRDPFYNYRYGTCLIYNSTSKQEAIKHLDFAVKSNILDAEAYFYMAKAYHLNYQFEDAITYYNAYKEKSGQKINKEFLVDRHIEMAKNGQLLLKSISELIIIDKKEADANQFYRLFDLKDFDGQILVLNDYQTKIDKKRNHTPVVFFPNNSNEIYFASYGEEETTGKNIYVRRKGPDGKFLNPEPIAGFVNTNLDEEYPYMDPKGEYLYFSSNGHNSMGGFDIFRSKYNKASNSFDKPENLDFAISSPDDDYFYIVDEQNQNAYFASSRQAQNNKVHVYKVQIHDFNNQLIAFKGNFISDILKDSKNYKLEVRHKKTNYKISPIRLNSNNEFTITLPLKGEYEFVFTNNKTNAIINANFTINQNSEQIIAQNIKHYLNDENFEKIKIEAIALSTEEQRKVFTEIIQNKAQLNPNAVNFDFEKLTNTDVDQQVFAELGLKNMNKIEVKDFIESKFLEVSNVNDELHELKSKAIVKANQTLNDINSLTNELKSISNKAEIEKDPYLKLQELNHANDIVNQLNDLELKLNQFINISDSLDLISKKFEEKISTYKPIVTNVSNAVQNDNFGVELNNSKTTLQKLLAEENVGSISQLAKKVEESKNKILSIEKDIINQNAKLKSINEEIQNFEAQKSTVKTKEIPAIESQIFDKNQEKIYTEKKIIEAQKLFENEKQYSKTLELKLNQLTLLKNNDIENTSLTSDVVKSLKMNFLNSNYRSLKNYIISEQQTLEKQNPQPDLTKATESKKEYNVVSNTENEKLTNQKEETKTHTQESVSNQHTDNKKESAENADVEVRNYKNEFTLQRNLEIDKIVLSQEELAYKLNLKNLPIVSDKYWDDTLKQLPKIKDSEIPSKFHNLLLEIERERNYRLKEIETEKIESVKNKIKKILVDLQEEEAFVRNAIQAHSIESNKDLIQKAFDNVDLTEIVNNNNRELYETLKTQIENYNEWHKIQVKKRSKQKKAADEKTILDEILQAQNELYLNIQKVSLENSKRFNPKTFNPNEVSENKTVEKDTLDSNNNFLGNNLAVSANPNDTLVNTVVSNKQPTEEILVKNENINPIENKENKILTPETTELKSAKEDTIQKAKSIAPIDKIKKSNFSNPTFSNDKNSLTQNIQDYAAKNDFKIPENIIKKATQFDREENEILENLQSLTLTKKQEEKLLKQYDVVQQDKQFLANEVFKNELVKRNEEIISYKTKLQSDANYIENSNSIINRINELQEAYIIQEKISRKELTPESELSILKEFYETQENLLVSINKALNIEKIENNDEKLNENIAQNEVNNLKSDEKKEEIITEKTEEITPVIEKEKTPLIHNKNTEIETPKVLEITKESENKTQIENTEVKAINNAAPSSTENLANVEKIDEEDLTFISKEYDKDLLIAIQEEKELEQAQLVSNFIFDSIAQSRKNQYLTLINDNKNYQKLNVEEQKTLVKLEASEASENDVNGDSKIVEIRAKKRSLENEIVSQFIITQNQTIDSQIKSFTNNTPENTSELNTQQIKLEEIRKESQNLIKSNLSEEEKTIKIENLINEQNVILAKIERIQEEVNTNKQEESYGNVELENLIKQEESLKIDLAKAPEKKKKEIENQLTKLRSEKAIVLSKELTNQYSKNETGSQNQIKILENRTPKDQNIAEIEKIELQTLKRKLALIAFDYEFAQNKLSGEARNNELKNILYRQKAIEEEINTFNQRTNKMYLVQEIAKINDESDVYQLFDEKELVKLEKNYTDELNNLKIYSTKLLDNDFIKIVGRKNISTLEDEIATQKNYIENKLSKIQSYKNQQTLAKTKQQQSQVKEPITKAALEKTISYEKEFTVAQDPVYKELHTDYQKIKDTQKEIENKEKEKEITQQKTVELTKIPTTETKEIITNVQKTKEIEKQIETEKQTFIEQKKVFDQKKEQAPEKEAIENLLVRNVSPIVTDKPKKELEKTITIEYGLSTENTEPRKSRILIDLPSPSGLVYRIQVGAFTKPLNEATFSEFSPISGETILGKNIVRYMVGYFGIKNDAKEALTKVKSLGYKDAFIVVYCDGKRISIAEADRLVASGMCKANEGVKKTEINIDLEKTLVSEAKTSNAQVNNKEIIEKTFGQKTDLTLQNPNYSYNKSVPGAAEAIPAESIMGLFYTVQVGVYNTPVPAEQLKNISPLITRRLDNGQIRYSSGMYNNLDDAREKRREAHNLGIVDAFLTAYYKGQRITLQEAQKLLNQYGDSIFEKINK